MSKRKVIVTLTAALVLITSACCIGAVSNRLEEKMDKKDRKNCIIRVYYAPENKDGEERYEFYEYLGKDGEVSVKEITRNELPEEIRETAEDVELYDEKESQLWRVELTRFTDPEKVNRKAWEETDLGDNIFLTWAELTGHTGEPDEEEAEFLRKTAESFYEEDPDGWVWKNEQGKGLVSITVIRNGNMQIIENDMGNVLYRMEEEPEEIFRCPEGGTVDYFWFL